MRAGTIDVQVTETHQMTEFPIDEPDITTGRLVFAEPRSLMVPAGHPFARRKSVSPEDLAEAVLVPLADADIPRYWMDRYFPRRTPAGRPIPQGPATKCWSEVLLHDASTVDYGLMWPTASRSRTIRPCPDVVDDELAPSAVEDRYRRQGRSLENRRHRRHRLSHGREERRDDSRVSAGRYR